MTLPDEIKDLEKRKFVEDSDTNVAVRTTIAATDVFTALPTPLTSVTAGFAGTPALQVYDSETSSGLSDGTQKTKIVDATGNTIHSFVDSDGDYHLAVSSIQEVISDSNNSSTSALNAGATFTGTSTTSLGIVGIQVNLKADQNAIVYVDQSLDGENWDITDSYTYYYSKGGASWTVQATASYLRVRVKNTSSSNMTYLRLQTALCPVVEAVPRSLDDEGYFKTGIKSIRGVMGRVRISPMGALKTAESTRLVGAAFSGTTLDTNFWTNSKTGSGTSSQAYGELTVNTSTTADSLSVVTSNRYARYVGANPNYFRSNLRLPAVTTANAGYINRRRWGAFTAYDGFYFEAKQTNPATTPTLYVVRRTSAGGISGEDFPIASGSFNGDYGATYVLDNNIHTYEIWWSNKSTYFFIDDVLLHTMTRTTSVLSSALTLQVAFECANSGGNIADNSLIISSGTINRLGKLITQPQYYYFASGQTAGTNLKLGAGNLHSIIINNVTNNAVITISDSTSAATPAIFVHTAGATSTSAYALDMKGLPFSAGLRLTVAAANASVTIIYE